MVLEGVRKPVQHYRWNKESCVAEWYLPTLDVRVNGVGTRYVVGVRLTSVAGAPKSPRVLPELWA